MKSSRIIPRICSLVIALALICATIVGCASQKDVLILDERLMLLERQNQELQRQNSDMQKLVQKELAVVGETSQTTETTLRSKYATLGAQMDTLQEDSRRLSGRLEEIEYQLNQKLATFEKDHQKIDELSLQSAKLEKRLMEIEQYLNLGSGGPKPTAGVPSKSDAAGSPDKSTTDDQLYNEAKQAYDKGSLDKARQGFQQLIKTFPKSANADNAQFWIGESYYREKWYEKAILEYQTVIEKYPNGNKVPAAMLKQGLSFLALGDRSNARLILKELEKKYPNSNEAKVAATKLTEF
ncbi:tol-pal system protein YbgF [Desulfatitalea tepidiphila]|uniref:tol-pal system protein YbgF n=1 Tax=Desulfatitalea tepidiphila TaxID=1185843 RepID=UPI0006B5A13E|nr:tol-pal system protein YbgF [Desulfatitalea tepidiphila]